MKLKHILFTLLGTASSSLAFSQDLLKNIPQEAGFVTVINSKAIVNHSSFEKLNQTLEKLNFFEAINKNAETQVSDIQSIGMDFNQDAYIYQVNQDSINFYGILIPLKKDQDIQERIFSQFKVLEPFEGFQRGVSTDGKTQAAWNDKLLFILKSNLNNSYFSSPEIMTRYGLKDPYEYIYDTEESDTSSWGWDETYEDIDEASDAAIAVAEAAEAVATAAKEEVISSKGYTLMDEKPVEWTAWDPQADTTEVEFDHEIMDSVDALNYDSYAYNQKQDSIENINKGIKDSLETAWLSNSFKDLLLPKESIKLQSKVNTFQRQNTLVHFWFNGFHIPSVDNEALYLMASMYGFKIDKLNYGFKDIVVDLVLDKNTLKIESDIQMNPEIAESFKNIYKQKINKKFLNYIPEQHIGYMSLNINTENYLKEIPNLLRNWYTTFMPTKADFLNLFSTLMEISLDEKAIAKMMRGDHLVFVNDFKKKTVSYIDYVYDDNYDYEEVKKTREEYVPNFLWMFTAEDQRFYKQLLAFGEKEHVVTFQDDIYTLQSSEKSDPYYFYLTKDIIFIGSDWDQIQSIKQKKFKTGHYPAIKKDLVKNSINLVVHANQIPSTFEELNIPISNSFKSIVSEMQKYGDLSIKGNVGNKGNIVSEISLELPKNQENALQFILEKIISAEN